MNGRELFWRRLFRMAAHFASYFRVWSADAVAHFLPNFPTHLIQIIKSPLGRRLGRVFY